MAVTKTSRVSEAPAKEETITKLFKDSRDANQGCGYFGYIENGLLVLGLETPSGCEIYFRGPYAVALSSYKLGDLRSRDKVLYEDILKYFNNGLNAAELKALGIKTPNEKTKEDYGWDEETKTILFKVKLFMDNREVHNVLVRGRFQADVIKKLMPQIPGVLTLQTWDAREFAVRSNKINAIEFVED